MEVSLATSATLLWTNVLPLAVTGTEIGGAVVGAAVYEVGKSLWSHYGRKVDRHHTRQFWSFVNDSVVIVHPVYRDAQGNPAEPNMARIEDLIAIERLHKCFDRLKVKHEVVAADQQIPEAADVVLVCSPKGNSRSREYQPATDKYFKYVNGTDPVCFEDVETGQRYCSPMDHGDQSRKIDFALVGRITETTPHRRRVFLLWGLHGVGTLGAANLLSTDKRIAKRLQVDDQTDFCALLSVTFHDVRHVDKVELLTPARRLTGNPGSPEVN